MKKVQLLTIAFISLLNVSFTQQNETFFKDVNSFLNTYVQNGRVDYTSIKTTGTIELNTLIDFIATKPYAKAIEKAYLINVYNLSVIHQITSAYPISSPMDVPGFFDTKNTIINGTVFALNSIENDLLRKKYSDPRLHFVLVCGAIGCPPITNFAYMPSTLDEQLEIQTKTALNNDSFIHQEEENKTIYLSEIFNWYSSDFGGKPKHVIDYINTYKIKKFNTDYKIRYSKYNWVVNNGSFIATNNQQTYQLDPAENLTEKATEETVGGQSFNAGSLLRKNQFDFTVFNTLYTQTKSDWLGVKSIGDRQTFNTHLIQIIYGISKNKRINVGLDINIKSSGRSVDQSAGGISSAFLYTNTDSSRFGIPSIGLKLKVQPFKEVSNFTIQSTIQGPTVKAAEGNNDLYWADWERITWWNQFFYTKSFGKFQVFAEFDMLFRFKIYETQIGMLDLPMSAFISYFPTKKITVYAMTQHVPRLTNKINPEIQTDWVIPSNYTSSGLGFKYQVNRGLGIELLYTDFWRGKNSGLGSTFNIGIKYITK